MLEGATAEVPTLLLGPRGTQKTNALVVWLLSRAAASPSDLVALLVPSAPARQQAQATLDQLSASVDGLPTQNVACLTYREFLASLGFDIQSIDTALGNLLSQEGRSKLTGEITSRYAALALDGLFDEPNLSYGILCALSSTRPVRPAIMMAVSVPEKAKAEAHQLAKAIKHLYSGIRVVATASSGNQGPLVRALPVSLSETVDLSEAVEAVRNFLVEPSRKLPGSYAIAVCLHRSLWNRWNQIASSLRAELERRGLRVWVPTTAAEWAETEQPQVVILTGRNAIGIRADRMLILHAAGIDIKLSHNLIEGDAFEGGSFDSENWEVRRLAAWELRTWNNALPAGAVLIWKGLRARLVAYYLPENESDWRIEILQAGDRHFVKPDDLFIAQRRR